MKTYWETITPERATKLLQLNINNRSVRQAWVDTLARALLNGEWSENGCTIKFNATQLLDGQHRLLACVQSGKSFRTLVVEGVACEAMSSIDWMKPRNNGDYLTFRGEKNATLMVATLGLVDRYLTSRLRGKYVSYSPDDVFRLLNEHPDVRGSVEMASSEKSKLVPGSVIAGAHYLLSRKNKEDADEFMHKLLHGVEIGERSSIFTLRERFLKDATTRQVKRSNVNQADTLVYIIKAWNAHLKGEYLKVYLWRENEDAPLIG